MENQDVQLALSMIVEEHEPIEIVERAVSNIQPHVDGMFITVTYKRQQPKTSPLIEMLKSKGAVVSFWKWTRRFDDARNFASSQIPKNKFLYYVWMDVDDIWKNPELLRTLLKEAVMYNVAAIFFDYWYLVDLDEQNNIREILVSHRRERLIRNDDSFKWIGGLHETLIEQRQFNVIKIFKSECTVIHLTNDNRTGKNLDRNIEILEEMIKLEKRQDPRTIMYLAKSYFDRAKFADEKQRKVDFDVAELMFQEYLDGSGAPGKDYRGGSGWSEERSSAWEYISEICRSRNQYNKAIQANMNALVEAPQFPGYYLDMAMNYALIKDWTRCDIWLNIGKNMTFPETTLITTPRDLKARAMEIEYFIGMAKQDLDRAHFAAERLVEIFPTNVEMKRRLDEVDNLRIYNKVAQSIVYVGKYLEGTSQIDKMVPLIKSIPAGMEAEQFVSQMRHRFLPARLWDKNEIAIICGPGFEGWSPKSLARGIGGSESAVIYQAKELKKLGYKVTVYADPREEMGEHDGVTYIPYYDINVKDTFNIVLLWRAVGFVDYNLAANQIYLWVHDVPVNPDYTEERLKKIDKIFVLSQYHRSLFRMFKDNQFFDIPDDKFLVTRNGAISFPLKKKIKRDPHQMIYTSSYDRGLAHLLNVWPEIKKAVPDAKLDIFYGWNTYDALFKDNPERQKWKRDMAKMMAQDGIKEQGRVSQEKLSEAYQRAGIFSYTCDFQEISCQNAMGAQIYGAIPVTTNYAALKETVQFGKKLDIDITSKEGKEEYLQELIKALQNTSWQEEERKKMMSWAKEKFTWSEVAKEWQKLFEENRAKGVSLF